MIKKKKEYWFCIETYVHIFLKKESLLLYNSLSGETLEYRGNEKILNLVKKLKSPKNLQVILLTEEGLNDPDIFQFVNDVRRYFMGDLIDTSYAKGKPVQMMPIIKIQKDVKYLKKKSNRSIGEDLMGNLNQIFLYINNECEQNCDNCSKGYKQFPCCTKENRKGELDISKIKKLLDEISSCSLVYINILGGNIFYYSNFKGLTGIINQSSYQKNYYSNYLNILENNANLKYINPRSSVLKILLPSPINEEKLKATIEIVKNSRLNSRFVFIVQSEEEFEKASSVISAVGIENPDFQPFFNGKNLEFFRKNVFITKKEILGAKPAMKDIYANSVINKLNFGRITILPNGYIYANINASRLGILGKDSIYDALYKEMYHGKSWRRIRKNVASCKSCVYEALCPPLTNFSYSIGRDNLCFKSL